MAKRILPLALFAFALTFAGAASAADTQSAKAEGSTEQQPKATKPKLNLWPAHPANRHERRTYQGGLLPSMPASHGHAKHNGKSGKSPD